MLFPETTGLGTVDDVPEHQSVAHDVELPDEASVVEVALALAITRSTRQGEGPYRVAGNDEKQAREALVPELGVQIDDCGPVVVVDREDRDGRYLLDAEDRGYAQLRERRAYRARVRGVANIVRARS